ncbi:amidohydrolase family protein [Rhodobacter ferrooxidans]|uniref:Amidohydrolase n=1 Tax=Rhodobacter ferrooxidans TaxID=371731 RepID=C8S292_9RHOB|nr:amidohydrolase [Rhodobacter sp. SW2]EEW24964.1 amidohydrolase [Rhodobacter sp. SW2]
MNDLCITNACVVTADAQGRVIRDGALAVKAGRIGWIGDSADAPTARRQIDAKGMILMPGLINAHCHAGDSLFRGLVEDLPLEAWLQKVWQAEAAILTPETARLGSTLGFAEMLLAGVTTVMDMFWYPGPVVAAARAVGLRVATGGIFIDGPGVDGLTGPARLRQAEAFFEEYASAEDVFPGVLPHGTYTCGPETLMAAKALTDRYGGFFSTHAAETQAEQATVNARYGRSIIRHMDALGLLDSRTVLAHAVHLDDAEIAILAWRGVTVAHCPASNLKLGSGVARVPDLLAAGVTVALGSDGAISGNDLDPWLALRLAATLHRGTSSRADAVGKAQALHMATLAGAKALAAEDRIGSLEVGKFADMILIDVTRPHAVPLFDPVTHLAYSTAKSDVRHVFLGGAQVVRDGALTRLDIFATLAEVRALMPRIAAAIA